MKSGKLSVEMLKRCVFDNIKVKRPEVLVHSGLGEDCSIIDFGEQCCVLSSDPITGSGSEIGRLAVHIGCNDVAASGVEPLGIMVTILAPEGTEEEEIFQLMNEINDAALEINVEVLGGHTEVTSAVRRMVVSTTAVGKGPADGYITSSGARPGDYIVVTKSIALEGTSIIARDYENYLKGRLDDCIIERAKDYIEEISVVKEGVIGGKLKVSSMHDATEGGLLGALWEVAESSGTGFEIYFESIPIRQETSEICRIMGINPLRLISSGMMIITTKDKDLLLEELKKNGIEAACIGRMVEDRKRRVIIRDGAEEDVAPPDVDELFKIQLPGEE